MSKIYWNTGILEYWNTGILEYWNTGILEYWNTGRELHAKSFFNLTNLLIKSTLTVKE
jgi:hypothetical protein